MTSSIISLHMINPAFNIKSTFTQTHTVCTHSNYNLTKKAWTKQYHNSFFFFFKTICTRFLPLMKIHNLGQGNRHQLIHSGKQKHLQYSSQVVATAVAPI